MNQLITTLIAALSLPVAQPLLMGTAVSTGALLALNNSAKAQNAESAAMSAETFTVRIEGATQGSGVLVKREGNRYTVLTAWHVVSGQRPGEELAIITPDGQQHPLEQGSIKRLGGVDMAVLSFSSPKAYALPQIGDAAALRRGSPIVVGGFPLASSAVPTRLLRVLQGSVLANASMAIPDGYQLLYSNSTPTLPGMSGGPVLNTKGELVGIHGRGETDVRMSEQQGVAVKTGTDMAVPIGYYSQYAAGAPGVVASRQANSVDDYLVQAKALLGQKGREQDAIRLTNQALLLQPSALGYSYRAYAKFALSDNQGAIADANQALAIDPRDTYVYGLRGSAKHGLGDNHGAIADASQALAIDPRNAYAYRLRGSAKRGLGDYYGGIADTSQALAVDPRDAFAYSERSAAKANMGDHQGAIADANQALAIEPGNALAYISRGVAKRALGDNQGAITDLNQALSIAPRSAYAYSVRGSAKAVLGDSQGAIADSSQALAIDPRNAYAYVIRGLSRNRLGDPSGACHDWRHAAQLGDQQAAKWVGKDCQ